MSGKIKMITELNRDLSRWFKVSAKEPTWFKVDKNNTNGINSYDEMIYIRAKSLKAWHDFMLTNENEDRSSKRVDGRSRWSGAKDWDEYLNFLHNGDEKVINKIREATAVAVRDLKRKHQKVIARYKFDVVGEQFDVGLVLSGVPEVWLEPEFVEEEIPQITIRTNLTFSYSVKSKVVIENSARVIGIAKVLENIGVQVKIVGINVANSYDNKHKKRVLVNEVVVKDFDEPINFKKVSAFITTAQFRRGMFYILEELAEWLPDGYGYQTAIEGSLKMDKKEAIDNFEKNIFKELEYGKV